MDMKKIVGGVLALVVVAVGGYMVLGKKSATTTPAVATVDSVAKVNGTAITKADYESQLASSITALKNQGVDTTSTTTMEAIRTQVLTDLINNELFNQAVKAACITVTPE